MKLQAQKIHKLTKELQAFPDAHFILAVSGGLDSMALLELFCHFNKNFQTDFSVAHFHHGPAPKDKQTQYRFKTYEFVRDQCEKRGVDFHSNFDGNNSEIFINSFSAPLKSEAEFREARLGFLEKLLAQEKGDFLVFAHHKDDLFETRLMRLIRGVGPDHLFSMEFQQGERLRPLLDFSKKELETYMQSHGGEWLEDPSNGEDGAFRNWIRNDWLPQLEHKRPGSRDSFARSLETLMSENEKENLDFSRFMDEGSLFVSEMLSLGDQEKIRVVAEYFRRLGVKNYGQSHLKEVLKRLDTSQKRLTFKLLGQRWKVDAGRMSRDFSA